MECLSLDTMHFGRTGVEAALGVDQLAVGMGDLTLVGAEDGDFDNTITSICREAGGFDINKGKLFGMEIGHWAGRGTILRDCDMAIGALFAIATAR